MTSREELVRVGKDYGASLIKFVDSHNQDHGLDDGLHIFNLRLQADGLALEDQGYDIRVQKTKWAIIMPNLYVENQETQGWVHETLLGKKFDYRTLEEGIEGNEDNKGLLEAVHGEDYQGKKAQRGLCVIGKNTSADKFEAHPYGNEVITPRFFSLITLIVKYDPETLVFDRSSAKLVWMPILGPEGQISYIFGPNTGHYAPHVIGVAEIALPDGTGGALDAEEKAANKEGKVYASHNMIVGTARAKSKNAARVTGKTETTKVLKLWQKKVDNEVKPKLEAVLSAA